ncbi:MAG TPA: hypothetical protein VL197_15910 [Nitrospirota bacterium]|nr:hypothetical protein [Nitrospirota bacterium]
MNWPHLHLIINHVPVIGVPGVILLLVYGMVRKSGEVLALSLALFVLLALMTPAVFFSGQAAEDTVKKLPGVTEGYIGRHEEAADIALTLVEILGAMSLAGLFLLRRKGAIPKWVSFLVLVAALITAVVVGFTANLGGQIRHPEIREGAGSTLPTGTVK